MGQKRHAIIYNIIKPTANQGKNEREKRVMPNILNQKDHCVTRRITI